LSRNVEKTINLRDLKCQKSADVESQNFGHYIYSTLLLKSWSPPLANLYVVIFFLNYPKWFIGGLSQQYVCCLHIGTNLQVHLLPGIPYPVFIGTLQAENEHTSIFEPLELSATLSNINMNCFLHD
jgi:hypothetical protein